MPLGEEADRCRADILCRSGPPRVECEEQVVNAPIQLPCQVAAASGRLSFSPVLLLLGVGHSMGSYK